MSQPRPKIVASVATPFIVAVVAACAGLPADPSVAQVPASLAPAANEVLAMVVPARGVQVYECRARSDGGGYAWAFVAPEAVLYDERGRRIGRHYAGPTWEAADGSKVVAAVKARADAATAGAIPWLLLTARPGAGGGTFDNVASIQRVNTVGGVAPARGCTQADAGSEARVAYTADYRFFVARL